MFHRQLGIALVAIVGFCASIAYAQIPMRVEASARQPDGKILMAGQVPGSQFPMQIRVGRVNADGTIDTSFGGGWVTYGSSSAMSEFRVTAIGVGADGRAVIAAVQDGSVALLRVDGSGNFDPYLGANGTGLAIDGQSQGLRVNAVEVLSDGEIIGAGSYAGPETGNAVKAALVRYDSLYGFREMAFGGDAPGVRLPLPGLPVSELRAVAPWTYDGFIAAGYYESGGYRFFLTTAFTSAGSLDPAFGHGGVASMGPGEASGVTTQPGVGVIVAGHDDVSYYGSGVNDSYVWTLDAWGNAGAQLAPGGHRAESLFVDSMFDASANAVAAFDTGGQIVVAGFVVQTGTGRAFFYNYQENYSNWGYPPPVLAPSPRTAADDIMSGAFPSSTSIVAVGTRDSVDGEKALRVRYFADTGEFDTDFPTEGDDATPNPFAFPAVLVDSAATLVQSAPMRVTGINVPVAISAANGEYAIECQDFTSAPGTVVNGQHVCVRTTSAGTPDTATTVTLVVGDTSGSFTLTTTGLPETYLTATPPNPSSSASGAAFSFYSQNSAWYAASSLECSLDGAVFATCSSPVSYSGLAAGNHVFAVRGRNAWGADPTPATYGWSVLDPADTTITSGPPSATNQPAATIAFASNDPSATFQCRLNAAAFAACTSPVTVSASIGSNTFYVRAVNALGTDATPASITWTVDMTAPATTLTTNILEGERYVVNTATFAFGSNEQGTFLCSIDGSPFTACTTPMTLSGLADGSHVFSVRAVDAAGNVDTSGKSRHWIVSVNPPVAVLSSPPSNPSAVASPTMYFSVPGVALNQQTFDCWVDGVQVNVCYWGYTISNLRDGTHVFQYRANPLGRDANNNFVSQAGAIGSYTWLVDLPPPQTTLLGWPAANSRSPSTFFYTSDNNGAGFECSLDAGAWVDCSSQSQVQYASLADGSHTFAVRARTATKVDPTPATYAWTVDNTPPIASITAHPPAASGATTASFSFSANESNVTFACVLGTGTYTPCSSPIAYSGLAAGSQTFSVLATDAAGNSSSVSWTWTIDLTAPDTTLTGVPSGTVAQSSAALAFSSNESNVSYECSLDGAAFSTCSTPVTLSGLADGAHTFQVRARDAAGNVDASPASASWTVDTTAPDTTLTGGPAGTVSQSTAVFTFTGGDGTVAFDCSLDSSPWSPCGSGISYPGLSEGMHMFEVRARDAVGNADATPATTTWSIDLTSPNTTISSGPSAVTAQTSATVVFSATESATFRCSLDGAAYASCSSPSSFSSLASGSHSFAVYSVDTAGNADASPATWSWMIDATPPDTTLTSTPPAASGSTGASFAFTATETSTFQCKLDAGTFASCSSPKSYSGLAAGSHTFQVVATDSVGNVDPTPASFTWTIDTTAPDTTITGGPSGSNNPSTATFTFTATESGSTFQCKLDSGAFATCASPKSYSGLARGSHTFQVKATDAAGNADATPASRSWSVK